MYFTLFALMQSNLSTFFFVWLLVFVLCSVQVFVPCGFICIAGQGGLKNLHTVPMLFVECVCCVTESNCLFPRTFGCLLVQDICPYHDASHHVCVVYQVCWGKHCLRCLWFPDWLQLALVSYATSVVGGAWVCQNEQGGVCHKRWMSMLLRKMSLISAL